MFPPRCSLGVGEQIISATNRCVAAPRLNYDLRCTGTCQRALVFFWNCSVRLHAINKQPPPAGISNSFAYLSTLARWYVSRACASRFRCCALLAQINALYLLRAPRCYCAPLRQIRKFSRHALSYTLLVAEPQVRPFLFASRGDYRSLHQQITLVPVLFLRSALCKMRRCLPVFWAPI